MSLVFSCHYPISTAVLSVTCVDVMFDVGIAGDVLDMDPSIVESLAVSTLHHTLDANVNLEITSQQEDEATL